MSTRSYRQSSEWKLAYYDPQKAKGERSTKEKPTGYRLVVDIPAWHDSSRSQLVAVRKVNELPKGKPCRMIFLTFDSYCDRV